MRYRLKYACAFSAGERRRSRAIFIVRVLRVPLFFEQFAKLFFLFFYGGAEHGFDFPPIPVEQAHFPLFSIKIRFGLEQRFKRAGAAYGIGVKIDRLSVLFQNAGGRGFIENKLRHVRKEVAPRVRFGDFSGGRGGEPRNARKEKLSKIASLIAFAQRAKGGFVRGVNFVLRGGQKVGYARENRALVIFVESGRFQGAQNNAVFYEDGVGVLAHHFHVEELFRARKIGMAQEAEAQNPLESHEENLFDFRALQILAQQHAKIGGDEGRLFFLLGKINAAIGSVYVYGEFKCSLSRVYKKSEFFFAVLHDFIDFSARQSLVQLDCGVAEGVSVLRHLPLRICFFPFIIPRKWEFVKKIAFLFFADMVKYSIQGKPSFDRR